MQDSFYSLAAGAMHPLLQKALEEIESATAGMDEAELLAHAEGKWSAAQALEHLSLAFENTVKGMNRCLEAGKNLGDQPSLKQRLFHVVVLDLRHFPRGREAPKMVMPTGKLGGLEAVARIKASLIAMDQTLAECREKLGTSGKLANHPVLGPLSNRQWCAFHYVHTKHHMKLIRERRASKTATATG
ncbi:MAG TPA: DUF1569 domain-containing protein [Terriglobales bacterium]|nr:DUF1569 domain-containing protein [Terriglobales bacterium]